ncbi:hypothetical protein N7517_010923 [Penicillium concentricum]|uniref:Secreted protein n=1 Tax=Penicillium concentricum TaxID=293559 RepID=A0A9W9RCG1_9EURO|nr:uncharacterized protein N7517_010923 [Penicillium concentricum]KAJ5356314.1 hypothetical protein N7517_010923 [Penicillium concentricum]
MHLELVVLAHLAASVSGLAIANGGNKLVHARDEPVVGDACEALDGSTSASEWVNLSPWPTEKTCPTENTSKGTLIHVKGDCIVINGSNRCEPLGMMPKYDNGDLNDAYRLDVADQQQGVSTVSIYAGFIGSTDATSVPDCQLTAAWPSVWGDLDFKDNCLTDRSGEWKQCCQPTAGLEAVANPYAPVEIDLGSYH